MTDDLKALERRLKDAVSVFRGKTLTQVYDMVRDELGGDKAACGDPSSCAIALYLSKRLKLEEPYFLSVGIPTVGIYRHDEWPDNGYVEASLPTGVQQFIVAFDAGAYPDITSSASRPWEIDGADISALPAEHGWSGGGPALSLSLDGEEEVAPAPSAGSDDRSGSERGEERTGALLGDQHEAADPVPVG